MIAPLLLVAALVAFQDNDAQLVVRPPAPPLEDFETNVDSDGVPDGWYNLRDASLEGGGKVGDTLVRFRAEKPSRPARMSRGFGIDGREVEALEMGLWVRASEILPGEHVGEDPGLMIDFLGADLQSTARGQLGPFVETDGEWLHWKRRIPVPPATRDAIMTVGLLGATGTLDIDGLTIVQVPRAATSTTNLVVNGDLEFGGAKPDHWIVESGAVRDSPGNQSEAALRLSGSGAKALAILAVPIRGAAGLRVSLFAAGQDLKASGGAQAGLYFLDAIGQPLPGNAGSARLFRWAATFDWREASGTVRVPPGASQAVLQVETTDARGTLQIDDVVASTASDAGTAPLSWDPYHEVEPTDDWSPYQPSAGIEAGSALDFSPLVVAPAGGHGFLTSKAGQLVFADGTPARFFGVSLLPPVAFSTPEQADALADRLSRSGVNLVRLGDLDTPLGLGTSLLDDSSDDTSHLDPEALARLDHLIAALRKRGVYVAIELQSQVRLRELDEIPEARALGTGGGPSAAFDPLLRPRVREVARALLTHVNPETGKSLAEDPVLAWVTLAGELSLFDLVDDPDRLPSGAAERLRGEISNHKAGAGRKGWQALEQIHWTELTKALRADGLLVPVAGSAHWRREPEFVAAQAAAPLGLIDDRLFWNPPRFGDPRRRSALFDGSNSGLPALVARKRRADRPYVVGQYASATDGAWALPFEGADLMFAARLGRQEAWNGLVRRAVARFPGDWGAAATGTAGGPDVFVLPGTVNGNPQVFAMLPHAASVLFRKIDPAESNRRGSLPGWEPSRGALTIDLPTTQGLAGSTDGGVARFKSWQLQVDDPFAVVMLSSADRETIDRSQKLLLTAVGRVQPTGFQWVDAWRREVADPGTAPLLLEPIHVSIAWTRAGELTLYPLDSSGRRLDPIRPDSRSGSARFGLSGPPGTIHWEIVPSAPR